MSQHLLDELTEGCNFCVNRVPKTVQWSCSWCGRTITYVLADDQESITERSDEMTTVEEMSMGATCYTTVGCDPETAQAILAALGSEDEETSRDMTNLIMQIDKVVRGQEHVTPLGLSYMLDPHDTGHPTPDENRRALETLVTLGVVERVPGAIPESYRVVSGAPVLAIA